MARRVSPVVAGLAISALVVGGTYGGGRLVDAVSGDAPPPEVGASGPAPVDPGPYLPAGSVRVTEHTWLVPGADGRLPVSARWARTYDVVEAMAVDGDRVYVADELLFAVDLDDGSPVWEGGPGPDEDGLAADGGVVIGLAGPDRVRVVAPYNYDLTVDRRTGRVLAYGGIGNGPADVPASLRRFPEPRSAAYDFSYDDRLDLTATSRATGAVAWRLVTDLPNIDPIQPVAVPGGLVLVTSLGELVRLDER